MEIEMKSTQQPDVVPTDDREKRESCLSQIRKQLADLCCCRKGQKNDGCRIVRGNDLAFNSRYCDNSITTSRYTILTFLPLNLWEQLHRAANVYFLLLIVLQSIPIISPISPFGWILGVSIVFSLTAIKYGVDDIKRHRADKKVNTRSGKIVEGNTIKDMRWEEMRVGQIVMVKKDEKTPVDLVLLSSSQPGDVCYVETADLDGETNLKLRHGLIETQALGNDFSQLSSFDGEIQCESPNNHLNRFDGLLKWQGDTFPLTNNNVMLRGFTLRNTDWVFGIAVYTGHDTKAMRNMGVAHLKRTRLDKLSNKYIISTVFTCMATLLLIAAVLGYVFESGTGLLFKDAYSLWMPIPGGATPVKIAVLQLFSYFILIQTLVPLAVYMSFEFIQGILTLVYINSDLDMYNPETDTRAEPRTSAIVEELGQVRYIFSDKTGTLTRNEMIFHSCSIAGVKFGDDNVAGQTGFYNKALVDSIKNGDNSDIFDFLSVLTTCNSVNVENSENGNVGYNAQSPDEIALVLAAKNLGFVLKSRNLKSVSVEVLGKQVKFDILCVMDFDAVRRRMSVVVRDPKGNIRLFCKGADTNILPFLTGDQDRTVLDNTEKHLDDFANEGHRTLCCVVRELTEKEWLRWFESYQMAAKATIDRNDKMFDCYCSMERDFRLIGATAVEDRLQDGVPETITKLGDAGIRVFMLTGDKMETAVSIGHSCGLLQKTTEQLTVDGYNFVDVEKQLESVGKHLETGKRQNNNSPFSVSNWRSSRRKVSALRLNNAHQALVINGPSLLHALSPRLEDTFLRIASNCDAVICCRVTPLHKAAVVRLYQRKMSGITLAIGDGANDLNMINTADVGIGISGKEGRQAVLASDFALAQFRFLQELLLIHGRWAYIRISLFLRFFFYKTFAFSISQFLYGIHCGWSATSVYDTWYVMFYNLAYTVIPLLYCTIFDQDVSAENSLRFPHLYEPGLTDKFFNLHLFLLSEFEGICSSITMFLLVTHGFCAFPLPDGNSITTSYAAYSLAIGTILVIVVTTRCCLETRYWTVFAPFASLFSIVAVFVIQWAFGTLRGLSGDAFEFYGISEAVWQSPSFWLTIIAAVVICCLPILFIRFMIFILRVRSNVYFF